ncbi:MAG: extracellular solute-binding protein [Anaerolineales bacterium]|nr:extracellular solute-binding protein [Anaerolineales bacterium]
MKNIFLKCITTGLIVTLLSGCGNLPDLVSLITTPTPEVTSTPTVTPVSGTAMGNTPQPTQERSAVLRIWVPPELDPNIDSLTSELFTRQVNDFVMQRPGLTIDIRVKAIDGKAGLLNTLLATYDAAPEALPDLIALTRTDMEMAASRGVLHPMDGLTEILDEPDWYAYARQMAHIKNTAYGLPFSGDALVLVYRASEIEDFDADWNVLGEQGGILSFPMSDPTSLFSLSLYQSMGVPIIDDQGLPAVDAESMTRLLSFYDQARRNALLLPGIETIQNDTQSWQAYTEARANLVVTWTSRYLDDRPVDSRMVPIPGLDQSSYTLTSGWVWALAGSNPDNQLLAAKLAEALVDSEYLAAWTETAGYLPPRPNALSKWKQVDDQLLLSGIIESSQLIPGNEQMTVLGPVFQVALSEIMSGQKSIEDVVQSAIDALD